MQIMKKLIYTIIFTFIFVSPTYSQKNSSIKKLIEKSVDLKLDMWGLTTFAEKNIKEKKELALFFYHWIGANITYDYELSSRLKDNSISNKEFWNNQDELVVYESKKAVCAGYAKLYKWFLDWVEIETVVISGHIRDTRNHYIELEKDDNFSHAWNAIKIEGKWMLVDTTWGNSNDPSQSEYYFNINPKWLIITHFPKNKKWQLLEKQLTLEEFNKSKYVKPIWFYLGFEEIPKLMADKNYYYFTYKKPNINCSVNLQYSSDNTNFNFIKNIKKIEQEGVIYYKFSKENINEKTFFKVGLSRIQGSFTTSYDDVINFKI